MPIRGAAAAPAPGPHAVTHEPGGADEVNDIDILNTGTNLSAHESRHVQGGADDIDSALDARAIALVNQGDIVFRGAVLNTLAALGPGVAGQVLTTGGPGANPTWAAATGDTRGFTIVVAASNSLDPTLAPLAYRCSGAADQVEINAAIVAVNAAGGGSVQLLEGTYNLTANVAVLASVWLRGSGSATILTIPAATDDCVEVNAVSGWKISDMTIRTTGAGANDGISLVNADDGEIFGVVVDDSGQDGIIIDANSDDNNIHDNKISNCTRYGVNNAGDDNHVKGSRINTTGSDGVWLQAGGTNNIVTANRVSGWVGEGIDNDDPSNGVSHNITAV